MYLILRLNFKKIYVNNLYKKVNNIKKNYSLINFIIILYIKKLDSTIIIIIFKVIELLK